MIWKLLFHFLQCRRMQDGFCTVLDLIGQDVKADLEEMKQCYDRFWPGYVLLLLFVIFRPCWFSFATQCPVRPVMAVH